MQKALNLFNAAMVTPTYYVYFTSTTIITSAVLFQGFKGSPTSIVTVVMGFLTICSGVVLLQLSKSAKDVPDAAVFSGDLDQIHTIAEQEQPETEPKADAIRGAAAIVRRFSGARQKMEYDELRRLREEKMRDTLDPVSEDGQTYEWDGLRRRRTTLNSTYRPRTTSSPRPFTPAPPTPHPPLGMSHFPTEEEMAAYDRPSSPGALSSIVGTIRGRARSVLVSHHPDVPQNYQDPGKVQSPMHPVQLTEIAVPGHSAGDDPNMYGRYGLPGGTTAYGGSSESMTSSQRKVQFGGDNRNASQGSDSSSHLPPPTPPPHGSARRQFSFQNVFRRHQQHGQAGEALAEAPQLQQRPSRLGITSRGYSSPQVKGATEEETLGLVTGDSQTQSMPALPRYDGEDDDDDEDADPYVDDKGLRYGRGITTSPPRRGSNEKEGLPPTDQEVADYERQRGRWNESRGTNRTTPPPPPPGVRRHSPPEGGNGGAFI